MHIINNVFGLPVMCNNNSSRRKKSEELTEVMNTQKPYLGVDSVLPVSLTGHDCTDLEHAVRGRQHPHVQLQELLWVVVVGQNRDVHPA